MLDLRKYFNSFFYKTSPYSQAGQDLFAYELFGYNGTYIDIGAGEPQRGNNCYLLEVKKKWKGFSVECGDSDQEKKNSLKGRWEKYYERKNKVYWEDAISFDYKKGLIENGLNNEIDFLSCDIHPQESTLLALKKVLTDGVRPKYIAFETDFYREKINYSNLAYNFLKPYGYKIGVKNVFSNLKKKKIFETWFVQEVLDLTTIDYKNWVKKY
jgi:hypothetical protein|tara:strand:- start:53 stop:688 length:636 start_codon:yes stop_codon:yes gene_type:complete